MVLEKMLSLLGKFSLPMLPRKNAHRKFVLIVFVAFDIILDLLIFKLFIVISFKDVSRTCATFIIDFLVTVVNAFN